MLAIFLPMLIIFGIFLIRVLIDTDWRTKKDHNKIDFGDVEVMRRSRIPKEIKNKYYHCKNCLRGFSGRLITEYYTYTEILDCVPNLTTAYCHYCGEMIDLVADDWNEYREGYEDKWPREPRIGVAYKRPVGHYGPRYLPNPPFYSEEAKKELEAYVSDDLDL